MNNKFNPYFIKFLDKQDIIEEVEDGYSDCLVYKITKGKHKYFLKIFPERFDEQKINRIKKYIEIYEKLKIKSLKVIEYGKIEGFEKYYMIYNFIEGSNLRVCTNSENYALNDIRKIGEHIGKEMLKLKNYEQYDKQAFEQKQIKDLTTKAIANFYHVLENEGSKKLITQYFKIDEIDKLKNKANEYVDLFKDIEPKLIHGDIKRANIMVDDKQNLYMVDIESMQINYDILNFKYQMTWALFDERETEFVKGYFDGLYENKRPMNFNQQVIYMIIVNFFNVCYAPEDIEFEIYLEKCRNLLEKIAKMDLNNEFIV